MIKFKVPRPLLEVLRDMKIASANHSIYFYEWLEQLDYVAAVERHYNPFSIFEYTLFFETEQDKMFFLLKYS